MRQRHCNIEGCPTRHHAGGYCKTHYQRFHDHGDPLHVTTIYDPWPAEKRAKVAVLLRDGRSASQIGLVLGVTRNSIIGLVRRDAELRAIGFERKRGQVVKVKKSRIPGVLAAPKQKSMPVFRPVPVPPPIPTRFECRSVPLMELGSGECRFPTNEAAVGDVHLFCGNAAEMGRSYCHSHFLRSVGFGTPSERRATYELKRAAA